MNVNEYLKISITQFLSTVIVKSRYLKKKIQRITLGPVLLFLGDLKNHQGPGVLETQRKEGDYKVSVGLEYVINQI